MPLPSVLCAFSFSRCCQAQRLISVLIWNNSRALHEAISLFPPQGVVAGRRLRAIVLPPCVPPAAAANIVPFYLLPLSVNQQGSQQRDAALIRVIRLIYERVAQWSRAFLMQCSPREAGHPPSCWQCRPGGPPSLWPLTSVKMDKHMQSTLLRAIFFTSCVFQLNISLIKVIEERDPSLVLTKCRFWFIKDSSSKFAVVLAQ